MDQNSVPNNDLEIKDNVQGPETISPEEITEETPSSQPNKAVSDLISLENLIKEYISNLDRIREEMQTQREMFDDVFVNDPTFQEHDKNVREANKVKSQTKQEILKQPSVALLSEKVKDMRLEIKEIQEALSDYLQQYQKLTGASEIELENGEIMSIINNAKLVKKSSEYHK